MTGKLGDRPLDELERRFRALRDQIGARPEAGGPELEIALQEVSQAIAAVREERQAGESLAAAPPGGREARGGPPGDLPSLMTPAAPPELLRNHSPTTLQGYSRPAHHYRPGLQYRHEQLAPARSAGRDAARPAQMLPGLSSPGPPLRGLPRPESLRHRPTSEGGKDQ